MRSVNYIAKNNLTLLHCGAEFFPALVAAMDAATAEIYLETYIFATDGIGDAVKAALKRAAARGVTVHLITDWHGTGRRQVNQLKLEFNDSGVHHRSFNPWFRRGVARSHRKICVVDRRIAFVGGLNINDDLLSDDMSYRPLAAPRWDFAVMLSGPLVDVIQREVEAQWARLGKLDLVSRFELYKELRATRKIMSHDPALAALVVRDNLRNRRTIQRAYLRAMGSARKSVLLANPYFAPGRKLRNALASAAARGVDVTLLIGVGQFRLQDSVAHSFYPKLLKSGVKVVEYRKTQLHAKVAVVDDVWATVGSSNCDGLSLFVNQEANIVAKDAAFAKILRQKIQHGIAEGVPVRIEDFANIVWFKRVWYGISYMIYKSIMRVITLGSYT